MKVKSSKYLGMTGTQVGILAGLALLALLVIVGMAWMILSNSVPLAISSNPPVEQPGISSSELTSTDTPVASVTPEPTGTNTPEGTKVPPGGWINFKGEGAEIWLPDSFVGGDMINHKTDVINKVRKLGPMFKNIADGLKNVPPEDVLLMLDSKSDVTLIVTSVEIQHFSLTDETTLKQFIDSQFNLVTPPPTINEIKKLTLLGHETRRLVFQGHNGTLEFTDISYFIKDGGDFWVVFYSLAPNEYMDMLPFVETSIKTFYLTK